MIVAGWGVWVKRECHLGLFVGRFLLFSQLGQFKLALFVGNDLLLFFFPLFLSFVLRKLTADQDHSLGTPDSFELLL